MEPFNALYKSYSSYFHQEEMSTTNDNINISLATRVGILARNTLKSLFALSCYFGIDAIASELASLITKKSGWIPAITPEEHLQGAQFLISTIGWQELCLFGPIQEELLWRELLQKHIFKIFILRPIQALAIDEASKLRYAQIYKQSTVCKVMRIALTATCFALVHISNKVPSSYMKEQVVSAFIGGITYGIIREYTKGGIWNCMLLHIAHNSLAYTLVSRR